MNWKKSLFAVMTVGMTVLTIVGCSTGQQSASTTEQPVSTAEQPSLTPQGNMPAPPDDGARGNRPTALEMDLAAAAEKLGVTEEQLREALGDMKQGPPDLAAAAEKLGISVDLLQEALGMPAGGSRPGGPPPTGTEPTGQSQ